MQDLLYYYYHNYLLLALLNIEEAQKLFSSTFLEENGTLFTGPYLLIKVVNEPLKSELDDLKLDNDA